MERRYWPLNSVTGADAVNSSNHCSLGHHRVFGHYLLHYCCYDHWNRLTMVRHSVFAEDNYWSQQQHGPLYCCWIGSSGLGSFEGSRASDGHGWSTDRVDELGSALISMLNWSHVAHSYFFYHSKLVMRLQPSNLAQKCTLGPLWGRIAAFTSKHGALFTGARPDSANTYPHWKSLASSCESVSEVSLHY